MRDRNIVITIDWCKAIGLNQWVIDILTKEELLGKSYFYILSVVQKYMPTIKVPLLEEIVSRVNLFTDYAGFNTDHEGRILAPYKPHAAEISFDWGDTKLTSIHGAVGSGEVLEHRVYYGDYLIQKCVKNKHNENYALHVYNYDDSWNIISYYEQPNTTYVNFCKNNSIELPEPDTTGMFVISVETSECIITEDICNAIGLPHVYKDALEIHNMYDRNIKTITECFFKAKMDELFIHTWIDHIEEGLRPYVLPTLTRIMDMKGEFPRVLKVIEVDTNNLVYQNNWNGNVITSKEDANQHIFYEASYVDSVLHEILYQDNEDIVLTRFVDYVGITPQVEQIEVDLYPYNQNTALH